MFCAACVYWGPDLESAVNFIKGQLFTTYPGKRYGPSEIPTAEPASKEPFFKCQPCPEKPWPWDGQTQLEAFIIISSEVRISHLGSRNSHRTKLVVEHNGYIQHIVKEPRLASTFLWSLSQALREAGVFAPELKRLLLLYSTYRVDILWCRHKLNIFDRYNEVNKEGRRAAGISSERFVGIASSCWGSCLAHLRLCLESSVKWQGIVSGHRQ